MLTELSNPKQEAVKAAIIEEQKRSEKAMEEAVKRTRDELVEYVREQRRVSVLADPCSALLCDSRGSHTCCVVEILKNTLSVIFLNNYI